MLTDSVPLLPPWISQFHSRAWREQLLFDDEFLYSWDWPNLQTADDCKAKVITSYESRASFCESSQNLRVEQGTHPDVNS
ncbi:hypothetical protein OIU78_020240 [Salix suchowensis]|nr:hypothetical protein OIU78_020240 [Salix suchowensis]